MLHFRVGLKHTIAYLPVAYKCAQVRTEMFFKGFYKEILGLLNKISSYFSVSINCN